MESNMRKVIVLMFGTVLFITGAIAAGGEMRTSPSETGMIRDRRPNLAGDRTLSDTLSCPSGVAEVSSRFIHRVGLEVRPEYLFPTNRFVKGDNYFRKLLRTSLSAHLKYAFQFRPGSLFDRIYGGAYQGVGVAWYMFGDRKELGNPVAFYLFQGARIARLAPRLSLNYEWNFGLSAGWEPYNRLYNSLNKIIGSRLNAYLNVNFYLNWMLSRRLDLISGVTLTHFSNGNTEIPNAGLNTAGLQLGLVYNFNRKERTLPELSPRLSSEFRRHISYDLVLFGSWRRKGVTVGNVQMASPDAYTVIGLNFAPMYNLSYKLRLGVSLDAVYDGSANVYAKYNIVDPEVGIGRWEFFKPSFRNQLALGFSGRVEYVMPYFTVGFGLGSNVLHGGADLKSFYQVLTLKIQTTRSSFLHIGYNLQNFHTPNYLMLGFGMRFNNKYPVSR